MKQQALKPTPWMDKLHEEFVKYGHCARSITVSPDVQTALNKEYGNNSFYRLALGQALTSYAGVPIVAYTNLPSGTLTVVG